MESLRWHEPEARGRPGTERVRPRVRPRSRPTNRPGRAAVAVAVGGGVLALVVGVALVAGGPARPGSGSQQGTAPGSQSLAALAPDVAGRAWLAHRGDDRWVWGRAGSRERTTLPEEEDGLAISDGWLASAISTPAVTRLRVRDLTSGAVVVERQLDFRASVAVIVGDQLLVTGYLGGIAGADGGILAVHLPDGAAQTLVESGPFPGRLGVHPAKGDFHVSGSGGLVAVNTCGSEGCDNVVIDLSTLRVRTPRAGSPGFLRSLTDESLVLTDADGEWIKGIDVRTGRERFSVAGASLMEPASMADGRVLGSVGGDSGWQVAAIDGRGRLTPVTELTRAPGPWVWPTVSSPTVAVLGDVPFEDALGDPAATRNTLIRGSDLRQLGTLVVQPGE